MAFSFGRPDVRDAFTASTRVDPVSPHLDIVALAQARVFALGHGGIAPVIESHDDAPCRALAALTLAYLVSHHAAGDRARHGGSLAAIALAYRIAEHATGNRTDDRPQGAPVAAVLLEIDLLNLLHHAASLAASRLIPVGRRRALVIAVVAIGLRRAAGQRQTHGHGRGQCKFCSK